jgi:hypothetical protein
MNPRRLEPAATGVTPEMLAAEDVIAFEQNGETLG